MVPSGFTWTCRVIAVRIMPRSCWVSTTWVFPARPQPLGLSRIVRSKIGMIAVIGFDHWVPIHRDGMSRDMREYPRSAALGEGKPARQALI